MADDPQVDDVPLHVESVDDSIISHAQAKGGPLAGRIWRVGLMGASSTPHTLLQFLAAFESALEQHGHRPRGGEGVAAAAQMLRELQPATV